MGRKGMGVPGRMFGYTGIILDGGINNEEKEDGLDRGFARSGW